MFAACSLDQTIEGVIRVGVDGFDGLVGMDHSCVGIIPDLGNVADRVVGVGEMLQVRLIFPAGAETLHAGQAESIPIVVIACRYAVAIIDPGAASVCIIIDVPHEGLFLHGETAVTLAPFMADGNGIQQSGLVVAERLPSAVRGAVCNNPVECIVLRCHGIRC